MERTSNIAGQGVPALNLPYRTGNAEAPLSLPLAPKSVDVTSPYLIGHLDVRWDNPAEYHQHAGLQVLGVNIYRAVDNPLSEYTRLNDTPVSSLFFRDQTREVRVSMEDALPSLDPGLNPNREWVIRTLSHPLVVPGSNGQATATSVTDVLVEVDTGDGGGYRAVNPYRVNGSTGEIYLNKNRTYDAATNRYSDALLPGVLNGGVRVSYTYADNIVATNLNRKTFYKVTTVAANESSGAITETPLNEVAARSPYDIERVDYIWAEAIRRNRWILEQGGERVKLFSRKWNGTPCPCVDKRYGYSKRIGVGRDGTCPYCYGAGYIGGYEGPYDLIIAPPESEKSVQLADAGLHVTFDWQSWTGPFPLLNERDLIVRQNNDRFYISRPTPPGSRGAIYQQHFSLSHIDSVDPVYTVPIDGGALGVPQAWNEGRGEKPSDASPSIPDKTELPPGKITGRTPTFENIVY